MVDDGAMVNAIDSRVYEQLKEKIGGWRLSTRRFRMANGAIVPGGACWEGDIQLEDLSVPTRCEVFDSGGSWNVLVGKPLLKQLKAVHSYSEDSLKIEDAKKQTRTLFSKSTKTERNPERPTPTRSVENLPEKKPRGEASTTGGVTEESLTPLAREVTQLPLKHIRETNSNHVSQYSPKKPVIEVVRDTQLEEEQKLKEERQQGKEVETLLGPVEETRLEAKKSEQIQGGVIEERITPLDREVSTSPKKNLLAANSNDTSQQHAPKPIHNGKKPTIEEVKDEEVEKERRWKEKLNSLDIPWIEDKTDSEFDEEEQ